MAISHKEYLSTKTYTSLDGIRCLSVIMVIFWHSQISSNGLLSLVTNGCLGVDLFFILSGFLITTLIFKEVRLNKSFSLKYFWIRRGLRIVPVYYFVIGLYGLFAYLSEGALPATNDNWATAYWRELPRYLSFTSNFMVSNTAMEITWSLSTEEQFYLTWPLILYLFTYRSSLVVICSFLLLNQFFNLGAFDTFFHSDLNFIHNTVSIGQCTFTPLCLGVLIAFAFNNENFFIFARSLLGNYYVSGIWLGLLLLFVGLYSGFWYGLPRLIFQIIATLFIASCIISKNHILTPLLDSTIAVGIGKISYGMYLYHTITTNFVRYFVPWDSFRNFTQPLLTLIITIVIATLSYRCIEKPFLDLAKKFRAI